MRRAHLIGCSWLVTSTMTFADASLAQAPHEPLPSFVVMPDDQLAAYDVDNHLFVALFGDSASMATMADAKMGNPNAHFYADYVESITKTVLYEATIGKLNPHPTEDQQHELLQTNFGNMARIPLSPYLGVQSYSLPVLIKQLTGFQPKVYNGAQMGGQYYFGHLYLDKFAKFYERNPFHKKPDLVIVNFNAMDFMENRSPERYQQSVRAFYSRLTAMAPYATLVITGMPDPMPLLMAPDRVAVPHGPNGPVKCSDLYKIVKFGNSTGVYPGAPESQLEAARHRLAALRGILENETQLLNHDESVYPHFKGQAHYVAPAVGEDASAIDHVAADCIHPDQTVHAAIGRRMWGVIEPLIQQ